MDIDNIPFGVDFQQHFSEAIADANLMFVVIGQKWLGPIKNRKFRMDDPTDFVRLEVEQALQFNLPIIPVLVDEARMPNPLKLPDSIRRLSFINAATVSSGRDFGVHVERLIRAADSTLGFEKGSSLRIAKSLWFSRYRHILAWALASSVMAAVVLTFVLMRSDKKQTQAALPVEAGAFTPAPVPCEEEKHLSSQGTSTPTSLVFSNVGDNAKRVYWINHAGTRVLYVTLEKNKSIALQTYVTHPWVIADMQDQCIAIYMPLPTPLRITLR